MAKAYGVRPSQILHLESDDYTAFCLDEACAVIMSRTSQGERCYFQEDGQEGAEADNLVAFFKAFEKEQKEVKGIVN